MQERRFTPISKTFTGHKIDTPSSLRDLNGGRLNHKPTRVQPSKPPKTRFKPGERFEYDGETWELIYMYRIAHNPGIWYHILETRKPIRGDTAIIAAGVIGLGAGATTPRIVYEAFNNHQDASYFFKDIYRLGDGDTKTTQEMLKLKKV